MKIIVLKIDGKEVVIDRECNKATSWPDFMKELSDDEPRYVLLDHDYKTNDGREADKIILVSWYGAPRLPEPPGERSAATRSL